MPTLLRTKTHLKQFFLLALLVPCMVYSNPWKDPDSIITTRSNYKYLGIQSNLLLQQFISFNSNSSINTNPYVFSYSKNDIKTGRGFAFGSGFNISQSSSNDGVSSVNVDNLNITARFGFEQKYFQKQRLIPFWGIDFGVGAIYNSVTSRLNQTFNAGVTTVETTKLFAGPDFRGGLMVALNKHILLGTEFYFNAQLAFSSTNGGSVISQSFVPFNIGFQAPTALFLTFRF